MPASAAQENALPPHWLFFNGWGLLAAAAVGAVGLILLWNRFSRHRRQLEALRAQAQEAQERLEEMELLMRAEPQALILWKGDAPEPARQFMHEMLLNIMPPPEEGLLEFHHWLEAEAAKELRQKLEKLRAQGEPFNISVRTTEGHLLEADGRPVGGDVLLRLRPLQGEALNRRDQEYEVRRLSDHARRITSLLSHAAVPVWITDEDGKLQWANEIWLELTGAHDLEMARAENVSLLGQGGLAAATLLPQQGEWKRYLASALVKGEQRHFEIWEREHEIGRVHWALDVTEREQLNERLRHQQGTWNRVFGHLQTAIAIFDANRRLSFFNRAFQQLWNFDEAWLNGHPHVEEVLDRLLEAGEVSPEGDIAEWRRQWTQLEMEREARRDRWQSASGRVIDVIAEPLAEGGFIFLFEDLTEHLHLETRYQALLNVQKATLDNLREVVAVFGTDGRLRLSNPTFAEVWGLTEEEIAARPHVDDFIARVRELVEDARFWDDLKYCVTDLSLPRQSLEGRITRADGRVFNYRIDPLPDGDTLVTWYEMTDAVRAEQAARERAEALEESDRVKAAFLDSISYEMRTPLTTINGYSEMIQLGMGGPLTKQQKQYLAHIRTASNELLSKIDTVLDLTAIDAGRMVLEIADFDIMEMFGELARQVEDQLVRRDMALDIEVAADVDTIRADRKRLMQALRHLLSNAIGFGRPGSTVRMGARRKDGGLEFWVADEGPGMDPESMQKAFERFFARPSPEGHRGPGLGLPLVKALIELHGGEVKMVSQEGAGTTVICRLPQEAKEVARA